MAGGHGHGEGHQKFEVPDWRKFKIDGIKELMTTQEKLAQKGLKDPWLRNETWRYHPDNYSGTWGGFKRTFFRGFKWAVLGMVITIAVDKYFGISVARKAAVDKAIRESHQH